jgi:hypothetical protein
MSFSSCTDSKNSKSKLKSEHEEIAAIMDKALLGNDPVQSFHDALPRIRAYASVDSAWISGMALYVKYVEGGIVSWSASPDDLPKTTGSER